MIGNDIIDLVVARNHTRVKEKRYWQKVLQEEEIRWLERQKDQTLAFHALWALKEATYKLIAKLDPSLPFSPKKMAIHKLSSLTYNTPLAVEVSTTKGIFPAQLNITSEKLEAFSAQNLEDLQTSSFHSVKLPGTRYVTQSRHTYLQVKRTLSAFYGIDIEKLEIQKENSIPKLYISHQKVPVDITMSHHGNWGAFGYLC